MAAKKSNAVLRLTTRTVGGQRLRTLSDAELLGRFLEQQDEAAFQGLVRRHGPMVLDVCRSVLRNAADAEDAFQATFLVLAGKGSSVREAASVGCWLHGVAYRIACNARRRAAARRRCESQVAPPEATEPDHLTWREVRAIVHEELSGVAESYRAPLVLCYLEGKTHAEAAAQLRLPVGTLKGRLERGRALLRARLVRRGLGPSAGVLAAAWPASAPSASVPELLGACTIKAARTFAAGQQAAVLRPELVALTRGVLTAMLYTRLKSVALVVLVTGILATGAGLIAQTRNAPSREAKPQQPAKASVSPQGAADRARLQGEWVFDSAESGEGTDGPPADITDEFWDSRMTFTADRVIVSNFQVPTAKGPRTLNINAAYTLDVAHKPKRIDLSVKAVPKDPGIPTGTYRGIYELEGDTLRLCVPAKAEQDRPTRFKATPGTGLRLFVLKRVPRTDRGKGHEQEKQRRLTVRAVDGDGRPLLLAKIGTRVDFNLFGLGAEWTYWHQMMTGEDGVARSSEPLNAIAREGWLIGRHYGRNLVGVERLTPYRVLRQPITLTMRPACRVHGRLSCPELQRRGIDLGFTCVAAFPGGKPCNIRYGSTNQTFEFFLPPGGYTLRASGDRVHTTARDISVGPGRQELKVDLAFSLPRRLATLEGRPAPELREIAAWKNGPPLKLADLRGKCVLLTFWNTGCMPSIQQMDAWGEMPALFDLYDKYRSKGLVIIGVFVPGPSEKTTIQSAAQFDRALADIRKKLWNGRDIPFPVALPRHHVIRYGSDIHQLAQCKVAADYGITTPVENALIDRRGNIVATNLMLTNPQFDPAPALAILRKALQEDVQGK